MTKTAHAFSIDLGFCSYSIATSVTAKAVRTLMRFFPLPSPCLLRPTKNRPYHLDHIGHCRCQPHALAGWTHCAPLRQCYSWRLRHSVRFLQVFCSRSPRQFTTAAEPTSNTLLPLISLYAPSSDYTATAVSVGAPSTFVTSQPCVSPPSIPGASYLISIAASPFSAASSSQLSLPPTLIYFQTHSRTPAAACVSWAVPDNFASRPATVITPRQTRSSPLCC